MVDAAKEVDLPTPSNIIGAIGYALGKELQYLDGAPVFILRANFSPGDTVMLVNSTLGAPPQGWVASNGMQVPYTGKTADSFTGCSGIRARAIPINAQISLVTDKILPPKYNKTPSETPYTPLLPAPTAQSVTITGVAEIGETLLGTYTYFDNGGYPEGVSLFRWLRGGVAISGATGDSYVLASADAGAEITFAVTPVSSVAPYVGPEVGSDSVLARYVEGHYLPLNGTTDYLLAPVYPGGQYAYVVKMAAREAAVHGNWSHIISVNDDAPSFPQALCDRIITKFPPDYTMWATGFNTSGGEQYNTGSSLITAVNTPQVRSISRNNGAGTGKHRVVHADGTIRMSVDFGGSLQARVPTKISIGATVDSGGIGIATTWADFRLVAVVELNRDPTDVELAAYASASCRDAETVWGPGDFLNYWPVSDAVGTTIPSRISGGSPMALLGGLVAADLVPT